MFGVPGTPAGLGTPAFWTAIGPSESKGAIEPGGIEALGTPKEPRAAADPAATEGKEWGRAG